ncbi:MAG: hypothetical protein Q4A19_01635 [Johnsonella sp.]|nr:hypothetical protein [Johnsonella sp.]
MEKNNFFAKKEGKLTIAFMVLILSFVLMVYGVNKDSSALYTAGFGIAMLAMMYSPFKTYVLDKIKKQKTH